MPANSASKFEPAHPGLWRLVRMAATNQDFLLQQVEGARRQLERGEWPSTQSLAAGSARLAFVACDPVDARRALAKAAPSLCADLQPVVAFLFPGLGGEAIGRLASLLPLDAASGRILKEADPVLAEYLGLTIAELVKSHSGDLAPSRSARKLLRPTAAAHAPVRPTAEAHALLFTLECALAAVWLEWGVKPSYVCGYSLGEYAAACVAGVFSFTDGLRLLLERAILLDALPRSTMLAAAARIPERYHPGVHIVAENAPDQLIYGGSLEAIEALEAQLRAQEIITRRLPVEHAFHTPLLRPAQNALAEKAGLLPMKAPTVPIISTLTGHLLTDAEARDPRHWSRHLCQPVRLQDALQTLSRSGTEICLEIGPGQALSALTETAFHATGSPHAIASMPSDFDARPAESHLLGAAANLWLSGCPLGEIPPLIIQNKALAATPTQVDSVDQPLIQDISRIWSSVLGRFTIEADDNLFDVGGNSLRVAQIVVRLKRELNADVAARDLFSAPTPRQLAALIEQVGSGKALPGMLTLPNGLQVRYQSRGEALYFYRSIFDQRCYLRYGVTIPEGGIVIDAGANIGMFSMFAAITEPSVRLFSCEPVPPLFDLLQFNLYDIAESAVLYNAGLAREPGQAQITFYPESSGMSSFRPSEPEERDILMNILHNSRNAGNAEAAEVLAESEDYYALRLASQTFQVPLITLSQIITEHQLPRVDLLKIDVQKLELDVLLGVSGEHWSNIRQVVAEVHDADGKAARVKDLLLSHGFEVHVEQDDLYRGTNIVNVFGKRVS